MEKIVKLALCGGARTGKDTAAGYLEETYSFGVVALADKMLTQFHTIFPYIARSPKPRAEYQKFAEMCREIDSTVWLTPAMDQADMLVNHLGYPHIVITDLRNTQDYLALKAAGYKIVRITASEWMQKQRSQLLGEVQDGSIAALPETEHFNWEVDYTVHNTGTKEELYNALSIIVKKELTIHEHL